MATKLKAKTPALTAAEVRAKIGDFQKEVAVELPNDVLFGSPDGFAKRVKEFAKEKDVPGTLSIRKASVKKQSGRSYRYVNGSYKLVPYYYTESVTCVVGSRPYTDEELEGADGKRVLASMERAAKKRAKDTAKLKALAEKLGVSVEI